MASLIDRVAGLFSSVSALYETKPHRSNADNRDGNAAILMAGARPRHYARHLDQNHDLIKGALDRLSQFVVGPSGIGIEPQPRTKTGEVHAEFAAELLEAWKDWCKKPEVTWEHNWAACQRLLCRSWLRDGEAFASLVRGLRPDLDHGTRVPFSLELLEADYLALDYTDASKNIMQGVERNAWNRPVAYHLYKQHPGTPGRNNPARKRVMADTLLHLKLTDRIGQVRGMTQFASVLQRMNDIYEYENAERIAARIAASLTGALKTDNAIAYAPSSDTDAPRNFDLQPGMILDNLRPGESLDIFSSNRPSPTVEPFRNGQLRAAAAGIGLSYSALSRDYNGTYSAQRQELVEQFDSYRVMSALFIDAIVRPVWETFIALAIRGTVRVPTNIDRLTLDDASFQSPVIPWIDPQKAANAQAAMLENHLTSPQQLIRERGLNPIEVLNQIQNWNEMLSQRGIVENKIKSTNYIKKETQKTDKEED